MLTGRTLPLFEPHDRLRVRLSWPDGMERALRFGESNRLRPAPAPGVQRRRSDVVRSGDRNPLSATCASSRPSGSTARFWCSCSTPTTKRKRSTSMASRTRASCSGCDPKRGAVQGSSAAVDEEAGTGKRRPRALRSACRRKPSISSTTTKPAISASAIAGRMRSARRSV